MPRSGGDGAAPDSPITDEEFRRFCEFFYRRTGMSFGEAKRYYVDRRLAERMAVTGQPSFAAYFARLRLDRDNEIEQLINAFTVNETYFFREEHQFRCLSGVLLDEIVSRKPRGEPIRIWSVPCSTGEEPYSIAIWLLEHWGKVDQYEIEILGSDIDTRALEAARQGFYQERALMRLPRQLVAKYFEPVGADRWRIAGALRESVNFTRVNVIDRAAMSGYRGIDVLFCRNMLIYFDETSRREAAENFYDCLAPGGYICLGHTESMSRISSLFRVCRFEDAIVYRRPLEAAGG